MGADTPAVGGDNKPKVKFENKSSPFGRGGNRPAQRNDYNKKEKFLGADPNLQGFVFEAKRIRAEQVANFERVNERIKTQIGLDYHLNVLESIETGAKVLPSKPSSSARGQVAQSPRRTG